MAIIWDDNKIKWDAPVAATKSPAGISNYREVEERISQRPGAFKALSEELHTLQDPLKHPLAAAVQPLVTGIKAANAVIQPPLSAIANFGMGLQEGDIGKAAVGAIKGLTQERPGNFSDVLRRANVPFSGTLGFMGEMGALNAGSLGKLGKTGPELSKLIREGLDSKKYNILKDVGSTAKALRSRVTSAGQDLGAFFRGTAGKTKVPVARFQKVVDALPPTIKNAIKDAPELKRLPDGTVASNVQNVNATKKLVGDFVNDATFQSTLGSPAQQKRVKSVYDVLKRMETRYAPGVKPLNKAYSKVSKELDIIGPKLQSKTGELKVNPITKIAGGRAELDTEKLVKEVSKEVPELEALLKKAKGRARSQVIRNLASRIVESGIVGAGLYGASRVASDGR
jgi:hypothetical protein